MSNVEVQYTLAEPLTDQLMDRISKANSIYGIRLARVNPSLDSLTVIYDASRLNPLEVEAALRKAGIAGKMQAALFA